MRSRMNLPRLLMNSRTSSAVRALGESSPAAWKKALL